MTHKPLSDSEIFRAAAKLTPDQRPAYLDEACGDNRPLRDEVESLLRAHDPDGSFLGSPAIAATINQPIIEWPGSIIGPYKLREQIGEGGFGVVYVAEQERPIRRKVALKVIKPGMDTKDVTARFEAERQALALMDHPNVARVLDAGTTDSGRPYFVMELVQGVTITDFCNRNNLPTRQRLALFADVCRAVQHAHQKGIIHRDLKPSNVMVTLHDGKPVAKVIDFGVSKALSQQLTEKSIYTAYGQMIGTPTYMSPEQAEMSGLGIDTRSDIYSLGVLLYELLTGQTPLDAKRLRSTAYAEILRLIREEEPPRPSLRVSTLGEQATMIAQQRHTDPHQLRRDLSGELDWIVMKCLEKDRTRRYETATGLARDIERYLSDEPVEACPPSKLYRLRKFTRKHRMIIGTLSAFTALLVIGSLVSGWLALRESRANENAQLERAKAERSLVEEQRQRALASQREVEAQTARDELRETLYAANMNLIQSSWENQQFGQVSFLLDLQRPAVGGADFRGWEWWFWRRRLEQGLVQDDKIPAAADDSRISPDTILSGDGSRIFRMEYRKPSEVPEPRFQAIGSGELVVNDRRNGKELLRFQPFPEATGPLDESGPILFPSHDGSRIAVHVECDQAFLATFDGNSGAKLCNLQIERGQPKSIALSQSGNRLVCVLVDRTEGTDLNDHQRQWIQVWDADTGESIHRHEQPSGSGILAGAISPDGKQLLRYSAFDDSLFHQQQCELVELSSGNVLWKRDCDNSKFGFKCWSPDGTVIVVAESTPEQPQGSLQLWDAASGETFAAFLRHSSWEVGLPGDVAISSDGNLLSQLCTSGIELFDVPPSNAATAVRRIHTSTPRDIVPHTDLNPQQVVFGEDGKQLVLMTQHAVKAWQLSDVSVPHTKILSSDQWHVRGVSFSPAGSRLAILASDRRVVRVWDTTADKLLSECSLDSVFVDGSGARGIYSAFSQDGRRLLTYQGVPAENGVDYELQFWIHDSESGSLIWRSPMDGDLQGGSVDLHPHGHRVVTKHNMNANDGSAVAAIQLWDVESGTLLHSIQVPASPGEVKFVRNGEEIALSFLQRPDSPRPLMIGTGEWIAFYQFFDAESLEFLRTFAIRGAMSRIDSQREGITSWGDGEVTFYDLEGGKRELRLRGILGAPNAIRSPDGRRVALATMGVGQPHEVSLWSSESGQRLLTFPLSGRPLHASFSADGNQLLVAHEGTGEALSITAWDATPFEE